MSHTYRPVATRKPGSIETVCETFPTKSAENWNNERTQSAHVRNPRPALYATVGYTFYIYRLFHLFCVRLRRKQLTFDLPIQCHT